MLMTHHKIICPWVVRSEVFRAASTVSAQERGRDKAGRGVYQAAETVGGGVHTSPPVTLSGMFPTSWA